MSEHVIRMDDEAKSLHAEKETKREELERMEKELPVVRLEYQNALGDFWRKAEELIAAGGLDPKSAASVKDDCIIVTI